ncbi:MAG: hypothetical protein F4Y32_17680 [Holophagales bacterium]|nr:hypothetical protein [Holophagales bacterium]
MRELLQNSLDALTPKQTTARVLFRVDRCESSEIPGIQNYWRAYKAAVKTQADMRGGSLAGQARYVADTMEKALEQQRHRVLTVLDNGHGLDERRMNALLSDGVSANDPGSTGAYGNGHCVAIPASDLRYVLYAGLTENGDTIASGHAVIASHAMEGKGRLQAGDGFLIRGFRDPNSGKLYEYESGEGIPAFLQSRVDDIKAMHGHGTAVVLLAFNNFRERRTLWDMVSRAAACNFFVAIEEGRLVVDVQGSEDSIRTLDRGNLKAVLENCRNEKRSRAFLSGARAWEAHQALREGTRHAIETDAGVIHVALHQQQSGSPRVDLCRNGMWITNDYKLPRFYYKFTDKEPFHAVLMLDAESGGELHRLIKESEGPLHNQVNFKDFSTKDRKQVEKALDQIRGWLREHTPSVSNEAFSPDDFLTLGEGQNGVAGWTQLTLWGTPTAVERRMPARTPRLTRKPKRPGDGPPSSRPTRQRRRRSLPSLFQVVSVPTGARSSRIVVECEQDYPDAEFRLCLDENIDATCDRVPYNEILFAALSNTKLNGKTVPAAARICDRGGGVIGIRLGDLAAGDRLFLETDWSFPPSAGTLAGDISLRVQVTKTDPLDVRDEERG